MRIILHPDAAAELTAAGDWYDAQRPGLGADLVAEIGVALDAISETPLAWPVWPGVSAAVTVRRFLLARFPFGIAYFVEGDRVVVLAVAHLKRRPGYWLRRS